ncbi:MAG: roadblock/LC7 domain-containing protein [Armatimonadetes bacterium]|nr:roadblock/LC7 domain-containing protein [Armatimonadota bacterium]
MDIQPVIIYEEDARDLAQRLDAFLKASRSSLVILIDRSGQIIAERGYSRKRDAEELAALAAAAFAATEQVAKLIGEDSFSVLFHQGEERNIHLSVVGDTALMLTAFDDRTTLGLVRLYAGEAAQTLLPVVQRIHGRSVVTGLPDIGERRLFGNA